MSEQQRWAVMCSMTGYWGVARPEHSYREDDGLLACTEWESLHDTWAEAMQEADRMARTVEITVPRPQRLTTLYWGVPEVQVMIEHSPRYSELNQRDQRIIIRADQREDMALQLLAHARKETP